ncbi:RING-type E3 ubiquitin transferase [Sarracenia purpurea var. burkii]
MGQRNMMCTNQMIDLELDQQAQSHFHLEPCVLFGNVANFPQPNIHTILPTPGSTANFDIHHLPDSHGNGLLYGMTTYNGFQNHHHPSRNLDFGVATSSNYYNPFMNPSGSRVFPLLINQGSHDQLPSSSNGGIVGVPTDDYRRNNHFMDDVRPSFKRKNAEGIPGSFQYSNASTGSSSVIAPLSTRPGEPEVTMMDASSFPLHEYGGNDIPSLTEVGSRISMSTRSGAIGPDPHNANYLIQGNYPGQAFQTSSSHWLDQQFSNNGGDGGTLTWSQAPAITYLHGSSVNGGHTEAGTMGAQGHQETASNRSSTTFMHLPPIYQVHPNMHHLPQPMQGVRGQNMNFPSQVATPSHRASTNSTSHTGMNPFQDGMEVGPRYVGPVPPTGLRIYRPHQRALIPEATVRHRDLPHLRVLPADEIAMLEISGYYEVGDSVDRHREMRLDIDHMSYEELLALGEQIGNVTTGLAEETISAHLKTRTYIPFATSMNLEAAAFVDQEPDFCVICQTNYKKQEKIGTLDCGHEYHTDCVKRWLIIKNTCPVCKSSALMTTKRKDLRRES